MESIYSCSNSDSANSGSANPRCCYETYDTLNMSEPIAELSEPIAELLIPKAPKVQMSGDVILLDLEGVVPGWETYTFSLDTVQPGPKVRHLHSS